MPFIDAMEQNKNDSLPPILYWVEVWENLTKYLPNGETEAEQAQIDAIEEEMYEIYPIKYPDPFMGAYHIAKALKI
jgi:hypothetical protein